MLSSMYITEAERLPLPRSPKPVLGKIGPIAVSKGPRNSDPKPFTSGARAFFTKIEDAGALFCSDSWAQEARTLGSLQFQGFRYSRFNALGFGGVEPCDSGSHPHGQVCMEGSADPLTVWGSISCIYRI